MMIIADEGPELIATPPGIRVFEGITDDEGITLDEIPSLHIHDPGVEECDECSGNGRFGELGGGGIVPGGCALRNGQGICDGCDEGHAYTSGYKECRINLSGLRCSWWARDLSFFTGVHGFKGPFDLGRNGNFGLHEGVNFGAPLGPPCGIGYQVGFAAHQSNFSGDQAVATRRGQRTQFFLTAGIFRRAQGAGMQWGVAFDLLRDQYYEEANLRQIRSETGYRFADGCQEIGYFGAYGTGGDELILLDRTQLGLQPTDMFAFFYRRHFSNGGDGRVWGGFTGDGDGLIGADLWLPIGKNWSLENRINYLIPKEGRGPVGMARETWGLSINLVWTMGQSARSASKSPYRPFHGVADNSTFMSQAR